jgi:hypothetical protein
MTKTRQKTITEIEKICLLFQVDQKKIETLWTSRGALAASDCQGESWSPPPPGLQMGVHQASLVLPLSFWDVSQGERTVDT